MTDIFWILQHVSQVPTADDWLSPSERQVLARFWAPKRIRDWRLGRWTAKRALVEAGIDAVGKDCGLALTRLSIRADESGVPWAWVGDRACDWVLSLSHSGEYGFCAVVRRSAVVGCDVETVGRRGEEFVIDWFTPDERRFAEAVEAGEERSRVVTAIWSAKESALKALGVGLRMDTRDVHVELMEQPPPEQAGHPGAGQQPWLPLVVRTADRTFHGWWTSGPDRVLTVVSDPPGNVPVELAPKA